MRHVTFGMKRHGTRGELLCTNSRLALQRSRRGLGGWNSGKPLALAYAHALRPLSTIPRLLALLAVFGTAFAPRSAAQTTVTFSGTAQDGTVFYSSGCSFDRTFSNTTLSLTVNLTNGAIQSGQLSTFEAEGIVGSCPFPPLPPGTFLFSLVSGSVATGGGVNAVFSSTNSGETAGFTGTLSGDTITGTLAISRGDSFGTPNFFLFQAPTQLTGIVVPELGAISDAINELFQTIRSDPGNAGLNEHQIAELAFTTIVDARNGFFGVDNQFSFLSGLDTTALAAVDHFSQSYSVSTNNTLLENIGTGFVLGAIVDPVYNIGKAITQSFGVELLPTGSGPQSPANFDFWALAGAEAAISEVPPGAVPEAGTDTVPLEPDSTDPNGSVFVVPVLTTNPVTLDPARARNYHFQVLYGAGVTNVLIPAAAETSEHPLLSYGDLTVPLPPGSVYTFPTPVQDFSLLNVSGPPKIPFLTTLSFAADGTEILAQTAVSGLAPHLVTAFDSAVVDSAGANCVVSFSVTNVGSETAEGVNISGIATSNGVETSTTLPVAVGNLISGANMNVSASLPLGSIGGDDDSILTVTFTTAGGTVSSRFKVLYACTGSRQ